MLVAEEVVEEKVEKKKKATKRPKRKRIVQVDPDYRPQYKKNMNVKEYRWILAYIQNPKTPANIKNEYSVN